MGELLSLRDIMLMPASIDKSKKKVETYIMLSNELETKNDGDESEKDQTIIVKRSNLIFNDKECQVVNFANITTYKRLK